ncbi:hypothetical protein CNR22_18795 [Sphingobacteriaceae bacterium]|nr:hypothetical protein CNR22_18795 [Sphingobacteriaceae bacterium]
METPAIQPAILVSPFKFHERDIKIKNILWSCSRLTLLLMLLSANLASQICDKKTSVFFDADKYNISGNEGQKLEKLCKVFAQQTDTFMLEVYSFSDSIASVEYNYKLAGKRLKTIVSYLKKNSSAYFEIKETIRARKCLRVAMLRRKVGQGIDALIFFTGK